MAQQLFCQVSQHCIGTTHTPSISVFPTHHLALPTLSFRLAPPPQPYTLLSLLPFLPPAPNPTPAPSFPLTLHPPLPHTSAQPPSLPSPLPPSLPPFPPSLYPLTYPSPPSVLAGELSNTRSGLLAVPWCRVVLDEGHTIKNHRTRQAQVRLGWAAIQRAAAAAAWSSSRSSSWSSSSWPSPSSSQS